MNRPPTGPGGDPQGHPDSHHLRQAYCSLPEQLLEALERFSEAAAEPDVAKALDARPTTVVLLGEGDAAFAGTVCATLAAPLAAVPVVALDTLRLPAFVGRETLVLALGAGAGDPASDTIVGTVAAAVERGARTVVIADPLARPGLASVRGAGLFEVRLECPNVRGALGTQLAAVMLLAEQCGAVAGAGAAVTSAAAEAARRRDQLVGSSGSAVAFARRLARTMPLVLGSPGIGTVAARRFKSAINENAKAPAWAAGSGFATEEACGFGQHGDVTRQLMSLVVLRSDYEEDAFASQAAHLDGLLAEVVSAIHELSAKGSSPLAQLLDLVLTADLVALELAALEGIDPGPVPASEALLGS